jgi:hypothetical protein
MITIISLTISNKGIAKVIIRFLTIQLILFKKLLCNLEDVSILQIIANVFK